MAISLGLSSLSNIRARAGSHNAEELRIKGEIIMQTPEGVLKARQTNIKKHGSEEAWKEWLRNNAAKGGKKGTTGGFYGNSERARQAGKIGGRISRKAAK